MIARVAGKPGLHRRRLVSGVIVEHQVDAEIDRHRLRDPGEELAEFDGAVALVAAGDDPDGGDVQGGEQRGDAVALAVMAAPPGLARPIGDSGWVRSRALSCQGRLWSCDYSSMQGTRSGCGESRAASRRSTGSRALSVPIEALIEDAEK